MGYRICFVSGKRIIMKLQYLGDSKDSFKWDYHDYLTNALGFKVLNILLMMTPNDKTNDGKTKPDWFPARSEIIDFCNVLRKERDISTIKNLPSITGGKYNVILHKPKIHISSNNRELYFKDVVNHKNQVVFLDPDNGMEPEKKFNEKHVRYIELKSILEQISEDSVISVFQHFRRKKFKDDFIRIKERFLEMDPTAHITAVYWHQLMFVIIGKSEEVIDTIWQVNRDYKKIYPVEIII